MISISTHTVAFDQLALWLEHYAESMELNVWTSSTVINAAQDPSTKGWSVTVRKPDGTERVFKVKHIVMATGFKGGRGYVPHYPGMVSAYPIQREYRLALRSTYNGE